jgi:hypothetical protein
MLISSRYNRDRAEKDIHLQNRMWFGGSGGAGVNDYAAGGRLGSERSSLLFYFQGRFGEDGKNGASGIKDFIETSSAFANFWIFSIEIFLSPRSTELT